MNIFDLDDSFVGQENFIKNCLISDGFLKNTVLLTEAVIRYPKDVNLVASVLSVL